MPLPEPEGTGAVEPGAGIEGVDLLVVDDRDDVEEIEEVVDPPVQVEHGGGGVGGVDLADQCGGAGELPGVGGVRVVCQAGLHVIRGERGAVMEEDAGPQVEGDGESVAADVPGLGERGLRGEGCGTALGPVAGQRIEDESGDGLFGGGGRSVEGFGAQVGQGTDPDGAAVDGAPPPQRCRTPAARRRGRTTGRRWPAPVGGICSACIE